MTTTDQADAPDVPEEFVGYRPAAQYLGIKPDTLSHYMNKGYGPEVARIEPRGQYNLKVFTRAELDRWKAARPGQGARTDLTSLDRGDHEG